jgi:hypothetical protein
MPRYVVVLAGIFVQALCAGWHVAPASLRRRTPLRRASLWGIVGVMLLWTGAADADPQPLNALLQGDYVSTGEGTCLVALPPGFNPTLTPMDGRFTFSSSTQGMRTFHGDGTGTAQSRSVSVTHPDTPVTLGGASSSASQESFTYTVAPDRTLTVVSGPVTGTELTGSRAGQTFTIASFPVLTGRIALGRQSLTLATEEPTVEVVTFSNGDVHDRICHRSRILLKLTQAED